LHAVYHLFSKVHHFYYVSHSRIASTLCSGPRSVDALTEYAMKGMRDMVRDRKQGKKVCIFSGFLYGGRLSCLCIVPWHQCSHHSS